MKAMTKFKVSLMRGHLLRFLELANTIEDDDWVSVIKFIQKEKQSLERMSKCTELGNIYVMLFFLNEILQSVIEAPE
jgi:hypothetical protein